MKKLFFVPALMLVVLAANAQFNVQLHYDFGRPLAPTSQDNRQAFTITTEFFKADKLGSTYMFVDLDVRGHGTHNKDARGAYWEMGRDFTFLNLNDNATSFTAHVEYDAGLSVGGGAFQQAALVGPALQWHNSNFSKTFTLQLLYKQYFRHSTEEAVNKAHASFQVTPVWGITFAKGLCTFSGFADLWYGYIPSFKNNGEQKKGLVFLSEPQFWFNVYGKDRQNDKFSIGTEVEISNNFIFPDNKKKQTFFVNPTIALKYTF